MINAINVRKFPQVGQPFRILFEYLYIGFDTFGGRWLDGGSCRGFVRGMNSTDGTVLDEVHWDLHIFKIFNPMVLKLRY